ncbi:MAG: hypothetical protein M1453_12510 [Acidobacteria bacterium]|nr:hypothetical protein [Acidobacteriota bacterium]
MPGTLIWLLWSYFQKGLPPAGPLKDPLAWGIFLSSVLLITGAASRFFIRLVAGKEKARGDWPCEKCGDLIPAKTFTFPWRIICPHCGHRFRPGILKHLTHIGTSGFMAWAFWWLVMMDREILGVWPWLALAAMWAFWYLMLSPVGLRPAQKKR